MVFSKKCSKCCLDGLKIWTVLRASLASFMVSLSACLANFIANLRACLVGFRASLRGCFVGILYILYFALRVKGIIA